jgi:molecular chaperone GrpE
MSDERERLSGEAEPREEGEGDVEILGFEAVDEEGRSSGEWPVEADPESSPGPDVADAAPEAADSTLELAELRDRHLRLLADFDNFRKRAERELEERTRYMLAEPIRELLPVLDNLERALAAQGAEGDLIRGVEMIARQFLEVLRRFGVEPIPAVGAPFDPRRHEAVMSVESTDVAEPTVVEELQRGYVLRDRLLRPALVRVAVPDSGGALAQPADRGQD